MNAPLSNEEDIKIELEFQIGFKRLCDAGRASVFPISEHLVEGGQFNSHGISKRELFAAMAMAGMLADPERGGPPDDYANEAVSLADALLAALKDLAP